MSKFIGCVTLFLVGIGAVQADEFSARIKKVDGDKITYTKILKGKKNKNAPAEEMTATASGDVKVIKGTRDKATKTYTAGDAIEGGLSRAKTFASGKTTVRLTTDDAGKVTQVMVVEGKKKKKSPTSEE